MSSIERAAPNTGPGVNQSERANKSSRFSLPASWDGVSVDELVLEWLPVATVLAQLADERALPERLRLGALGPRTRMPGLLLAGADAC